MWNQVKKWIYPNKCIVCGKLTATEHEIQSNLCPRCYSGLIEHYICEKCGKPYGLGEPCIYCGNMPRNIRCIRSLFPYRDLYSESIKRWKYSGIRKYSKIYGELFTTHILGEVKIEIDLLVPIPISDKRYELRGFNQALDFAMSISEYTEIPVWDGLKRVKNTKPQSACTKEERVSNISGTILCNDKDRIRMPNKIALIDDIYTTGSTVNECASVLKSHYPEIEEIVVFTVCVAI